MGTLDGGAIKEQEMLAKAVGGEQSRESFVLIPRPPPQIPDQHEVPRLEQMNSH